MRNQSCLRNVEPILFLGFLAYIALGKSDEEAIQAGIYCASECIQQSGCMFPEKPNFDPATFV